MSGGKEEWDGKKEVETGKGGKRTEWHAGEEESRGFVTKTTLSSNHAQKTGSIDDEAEQKKEIKALKQQASFPIAT